MRFDFIDFLDSHKKEYIEKFIPLCDELNALDIQRQKLRPNNNYNDRQQYNNIQSQINDKFPSITINIHEPILNTLRELKIWDGDYAYASIWNNNISSISEFISVGKFFSAVVNSKTGQLVGVATLKDEQQEVIVVSSQGQTIRLGLKEIPGMSRATQGVRIMRLNDGDDVTSIAVVEKSIEQESEEEPVTDNK